MGVSLSSQVIIEAASLNTRQNAENVKRILNEHGFHRPILVTSAFHMPRAIWFFRQQGVEVIPYPADYQVNQAFSFSVHKLFPAEGALWSSSLVLREYLGLVGTKLLYK
ncbi:YdcF family protein [Sporomusa sp. GT1]|uniref:YdcF family protein n=1 Tax=Sporomusa sp. GT1 TaxID=1534747 RepID=UPI00166D9615|nr:YdcF family protein [Sporomusa sp. GT1]